MQYNQIITHYFTKTSVDISCISLGTCKKPNSTKIDENMIKKYRKATGNESYTAALVSHN